MIVTQCYNCGMNILACEKACKKCGCSRVISEIHDVVNIAVKAGNPALAGVLAASIAIPKD